MQTFITEIYLIITILNKYMKCLSIYYCISNISHHEQFKNISGIILYIERILELPHFWFVVNWNNIFQENSIYIVVKELIIMVYMNTDNLNKWRE